MQFAGSGVWFAVLLTVHVFGAIAGIGVNFASPFVARAGRASPAAEEVSSEISFRMTRYLADPVWQWVQPLSGVGLIFNRGLDHAFFSWHRAWLIGAIGIYIVESVLLAMVAKAAGGLRAMRADGVTRGADYEALKRREAMLVPPVGVLTVAIIVLMILKPGGGCGSLLRC